jgi:hypothetical protein
MVKMAETEHIEAEAKNSAVETIGSVRRNHYCRRRHRWKLAIWIKQIVPPRTALTEISLVNGISNTEPILQVVELNWY